MPGVLQSMGSQSQNTIEHLNYIYSSNIYIYIYIYIYMERESDKGECSLR